MNTLIVTPLQKEMDAFLAGCAQQGARVESGTVGRLQVTRLPDLGWTVARGGVGKAQFAVHTQHLLDSAAWDLMICAGAAGALVPDFDIGDVIVGTTVIEHDYKNGFSPRPRPRFECHAETVAALRQVAALCETVRVHFGDVASGDEDVIDADRRDTLRQFTGALAVAWEGAGGARACAFSHVPFVEVRGLTDKANLTAPADFETNLHLAMGNVAILLTHWRRNIL